MHTKDRRNEISASPNACWRKYMPGTATICAGPGIFIIDDKPLSIEPLFDVIESSVAREFNGWNGDTIVRWDNGQIWEQIQYKYAYTYKYRPKVIVYRSGNALHMQIEGMDPMVVQRLK